MTLNPQLGLERKLYVRIKRFMRKKKSKPFLGRADLTTVIMEQTSENSSSCDEKESMVQFEASTSSELGRFVPTMIHRCWMLDSRCCSSAAAIHPRSWTMFSETEMRNVIAQLGAFNLKDLQIMVRVWIYPSTVPPRLITIVRSSEDGYKCTCRSTRVHRRYTSATNALQFVSH